MKRPPLAPPEFATREDLHRLLLKASQLEGERQVPAKLREMLILWGRRIEEILHDRPVEDPIRWADVTAELGPDAWELANAERCQEVEQGESIVVDGIPDITPGGPGLRLVPRE